MFVNKEDVELDDINVLKHKQADLQRRVERVKITPLWILSTAFIGVLVSLAIYFLYPEIIGQGNKGQTIQKAFSFAVIGAITAEFLYLYTIAIATIPMKTRLRDVGYRLAKLGVNELQENIDEDFFNKLIQINFKYIDQYYLQTQEQANKSFMLSAGAAITGLLIIATGIVMMFLGKTEPAYVTASAGILSEFIAAVFFYLYNKTILKMSDYHQKLVITQNVSLALKISEDLPDEEKKKSKVFLIEKLTENVNNLLANNAK